MSASSSTSLARAGARALAAPLLVALRTYHRHAPKAGQERVWRALGAHLWWAERRRTRARTWFGARMAVDPRDIVGRYIAYFGVWEPSLTQWLVDHLRPGDTFVDVGANIGYFTLLASELVGPSGRVIAIEPAPTTLEMLRRNVSANRATNVRIVPAAVSDHSTTLPLYGEGVDGKNTLSREWARRHSLTEFGTVAVAPLADLLHPDEQPSVIKIDVEGHELSALKSARALLTARPAVVVETLSTNARPAMQLMEEFGYQAYEMPNDYALTTYIHHRAETPVAVPSDFSDREQIDLLFRT